MMINLILDNYFCSTTKSYKHGHPERESVGGVSPLPSLIVKGKFHTDLMNMNIMVTIIKIKKLKIQQN